MPASEVTFPVGLDLVGVTVGALQGALFGATRTRVTVVGVVVFGFVTALGGSLTRDVLIGRGPPAALADQRYLLTALCATLVGIVVARLEHHLTGTLTLLDSALLGVWCISGTDKALHHDFGIASAVLLGVITGVGGGILRDLLASKPPTLFESGPIYTLACAAGAVLFAALHATAVPRLVLIWLCIGVVFSMRTLSLRFGWFLPPASALVPDLSRRSWRRPTD